MGHTYMWCVQMGSHGLLLDLETFLFIYLFIFLAMWFYWTGIGIISQKGETAGAYRPGQN